jgi:aspartate 1-decarboxylase
MQRTFMHAKIHRATVTGSDLGYVGSLTLSPELLDIAGIGLGEFVQVVNINNGARFETYTILGEPGAYEVIVNGAAARLVQAGDKIIIMTYAQLAEEELAGHESKVVFVDDGNRPVAEAHDRPLAEFLNR